MRQAPYGSNEAMREVYHKTDILRKPISGIVSGYHRLPYILVAPDDDDESATVEISGRIDVSPRFVITPSMLGDTFGEVFDPETFEGELKGRLFSFAYSRKKNFKLESEEFEVRNFEERPKEHVERVHDDLMRQENVTTALIFGPKFAYYPISLDRFLSEILDREFNL